MTKRLKSFLCMILVIAALFVIRPLPLTSATTGGNNETLTIRGDGVEKQLVFTRAELESLSVIERHRYSSANNFPTNRIEYVSGIPLKYVLQQAGIKDAATLLTFTASDGYKRTFTAAELLTESRYCYIDGKVTSLVPVMICLKSSDDSFDKLESSELRLVMGQRAPGEQTNPWFVKYLSTIEVSCAKPDRWPEVRFSKTENADGITLQLLHDNIDSIKIYYTTDGSEPTVRSNVYNISASYFQPQLNKPVIIDKTTTVRAVAIGPGKENSIVSSFTVTVGGEIFSDLEGYDWAKPAILELYDLGVVNGVGNNRFDPAGSLTRGMFVTMLGRALGGDATNAVSPAPDKKFPDVDYSPSSWYGRYVQWAVDKKIVNGYPDGTFRPNNTLTVEEMITMAVRAGGLDIKNTGTSITITGVSDWAKPFVIAAEKNNMLVRGVLAVETGGVIKVEGQRQATRAEAAVMVYQLLQAV